MRCLAGHHGTSPELLAQIQAPTLIHAGEEEYGGTDEARQAQRNIPDARLVTVLGAGHMVLIDQPEIGTTAINDFIRGSTKRNSWSRTPRLQRRRWWVVHPLLPG